MLVTIWLLISLTGNPVNTINAYETKTECMRAKEKLESIDDKMCIEFTYLVASNVNSTKDYKKFT